MNTVAARAASVERNTKRNADHRRHQSRWHRQGRSANRRAVPRPHARPAGAARHDGRDGACQGDLHGDAHHPWRTSASRSVRRSSGRWVTRAASTVTAIPCAALDEALSRVWSICRAVQGFEFHVPFTRAMIGTFDVDLTHEFFQGFVNHAGDAAHRQSARRQSAHHQCETVFRSVRASRAWSASVMRALAWWCLPKGVL